MPTDRPHPKVRSGRGARLYLLFPTRLAEGLQAIAQREGVTLFVAQLAVVKILLHRWSGQDDISVGTATAGRNRIELESLIGFFVNTLVLRTGLSGEPTFRELLGRVREATLGAFAHQDIPFERLVEELHPHRDLTHTPLFQVMFAAQVTDSSGPSAGSEAAGDLSLRGLEISNQTAKFDLVFHLVDDPGGLGGWVELDTDIYEPATILRMIGHLEVLFGSAIAEPDVPIWRLPLLTAAEEAAGAPRVERHRGYPRRADRETAFAMFAAQAERTPEALALVFGDERLTYAETRRRTSALAGRLRELGVGPDSPVAICAERSMELLIAMLAVLEAGGAYVPLDPAHPAERLEYMLADSGARVLMSSPPNPLSHLPPSLSPGEGERRWSEGGEPGHKALDAFPLSRRGVEGRWERGTGGEVLPLPDHPGYIIYTSGTTGRPKGIALTQRALVNMVRWHIGAYGGGRRVLGFSSFSFDVFFQELLTALASGGSLHLLTESARRDAEAMARYIEEEKIEEMVLAVVVLQQLAEVCEGREERLASLRWVTTVGEAMKITPAVARLFERLPACRLRNFYGPAETHGITAHMLAGPPGTWPAGPPIGRPIANARQYILDRNGAPVPAVVPGELFLGGVSLARGYTGKPDLTAERFVPNPFSEQPGERLYKTGDLARWQPDGVIDFLGRIDHQVKIRGIRVEPAEIEAALSRHPDVREAVVLVQDEGGVTGKRLVAYFAAESDPPPPEALRAFLGRSLPEVMIPSLFVPLPALPLTPHGKVDRRVLARMGSEAAIQLEAERPFEPPRDPVEQELAGIWGQVLAAERVGRHDSFFALGGHSLLATQLLARVTRAFGVELPLRDLFERPTVAELADRIRSARTVLAGPAPPPITPRPERPVGDWDEALVSFQQRRLWFLDRLQPGSAAYNVPAALRLEGDLDVPALAAALAGIVRRHEALRTTFAERAGEPVQRIAPASTPELPLTDLAGLLAEVREEEARRIALEEAARPFDLARGPLLRVWLLRLGPAEHALLVMSHHIVSDGWSLQVFQRDLGTLYDAFSRRLPSPLPALPIQYADFALWQRGWLQGEVLERQLAWWRERLAGASPVLDLPTDRPRPPIQSQRGAYRWRRLPDDLAANVRALARGTVSTPFAVLLAAFQVVLARHAHQEDFCVGSPTAGRDRLETEGLIGLFANVLVLRAGLAGEPGFAELAGRVRESILASHAHADLPFERLVEELQPERMLDRSPLFQVAFGLLTADPREAGLPGLRVSPLVPTVPAVKYEIFFNVLDTGEAINLGIEYAADLFEPATLDRLADGWQTLLAAAAADPARPVFSLPLLSEAERHQLLEESQGDRKPVPEGLLHEPFLEQARRTPEAPALVQGDQRLTYAELAERSGRLASHLLAMGIGAEDRVGIRMETSVDAIVAILAVLQAGGAYVPLDPAYPEERLRQMAEDAGLAATITREVVEPAHPGLTPGATQFRPPGSQILGSPEPGGRHSVAQGVNPGLGRRPRPESLAYVLFTSGSTGRPKGVACHHAGVLNHLAELDERAPVPVGAASSVWTSLSFDPSVWEVFSALLSGGRLEIPPAAVRADGRAFAAWLAERGIESAYVPPMLLADLAAAPPPSLRRLLVGVEPIPEPLLASLMRSIPGLRILNGYGPTEATICATLYPVGPEARDRRTPIGRPLRNARAWLLDRHLEPVPPGAAGEVWLSGVGLARGYLGRPDLTAERFLPEPFAGIEGERMYRTGDLARRLADGNLEFLGRIDHQVKIRGLRIELGEIEAALASCPGVREAAVLVREDRPGDKRLVAYVVGDVPPRELRAFLRSRLPEPMLPSAFVRLDALPLTPAGKVDRRALPAPERTGDREALPPRDAVELELVHLWEDMLGVRPIGVRDSFFELGGHSLLAILLMARLRERFGRDLPVAVLFMSPTIEDLATVLRQEGTTVETDPLVAIQPAGTRPPLFLVHPAGGSVLGYAPLANMLGPDHPVYGFQATGAEATIEDMADRYLRSLRNAHPQGPYRLGGWSLGGLVAFEMARRLEAEGESVDLILIDTMAPGHYGDPLPDSDLVLALAADLGARIGIGLPAMIVEELRSLDINEGLRRLLGLAREADLLPPGLDLVGARRLFETFRTHAEAARCYEGGTYGGKALLFRPEDTPRDSLPGWEGRVAELGVASIPGDHYSILRPPHIDDLVSRLVDPPHPSK